MKREIKSYKMRSNKHYRIISELGSGTYGKVFEVEDENSRILALKKIKSDLEGIPCLLEAVIMKCIKHPNLNEAIDIFCTESDLNIVQEKAISDLSKFTKKKVTPLKDIRNWCYQILSGVFVLHRLGFIHADIKASNILLFEGNRVKLSDFTLIAKMWSPGDMFTSFAGTNTHTAPEILIEKAWNRQIDIWSLGCTFYQIAFGKLLFNLQEKSQNVKETRMKYHNAILGYLDMTESSIGNIKYIPADNESLLYTSEYRLFKDLLSKMLKYNSYDRPNIQELMNHSFFTGFSKIPPKIVCGKMNDISGKKLDKLSTKIMRMYSESRDLSGKYIFTPSEVSYMGEIAIETYKRCYVLVKSKGLKEIILAGCCWISCKIVTGFPPKLLTSVDRERIVISEKEICNYLSYCIPIGFKTLSLD